MKKLLLAVCLLGVSSSCAFAQGVPALGLATISCGTAPTTYANKSPGPFTVDLNGTLCMNGTFTGTVTANTTAKATAASPTYVEGTNNPLSMDLSGNLRTLNTPLDAAVTTVNSTVATGGTFQVALAANASRKGCIVTNTGSHTEYVYFGATGSATLSNATPLAPGQQIFCVNGGVVSPDIVNITTAMGFSGDGYIVNSQ